MRHVTELRPAFVKLDAQLIRGLRNNTARQALVRALVSFTGAIGATPIAEGVEEPPTSPSSRTRQPLLLQGYAIARPGPAWPAIEAAALGSATARRRRALLPVVASEQRRRHDLGKHSGCLLWEPQRLPGGRRTDARRIRLRSDHDQCVTESGRSRIREVIGWPRPPDRAG